MTMPHLEPLNPFEQLVQDDIKNEASRAEADELREPDNAQDWSDELINVINRIDLQLSQSKAKKGT